MNFLSRLRVAIFTLIAVSIVHPAGLAAQDSDPGHASRPLVVTFLDVGQGDSALIETPDGHAVLIDGGGGGEGTRDAAELAPFDAGGRVLLPVLQRKGIATLDLVIATHPHSDHIGGLVRVLAEETISVGEFWQSDYPWPSIAQERLQDRLRNRRVSSITPREGDVRPFGEARIAVLHVGWKAPADPQARDGDAANNSSIVVRLEFGMTSFLFTGDCEEQAEKRMLSRHMQELRSTVLKVGHQGSKTSSCEEFISAVAPAYAVISSGHYSKDRHPDDEVVNRIGKCVGSERLYRTDDDSHIVFTVDALGAIGITTARDGPDSVDLPTAEFAPPEVSTKDLANRVGEWVRLQGNVARVDPCDDGSLSMLVGGETWIIVESGAVTRRWEEDDLDLRRAVGWEVTLEGLVMRDETHSLRIIAGGRHAPRFRRR
ncbi:MAG: MBL fold metallo-hydrolase [Planctomycetes bacterium]|nr:MBL fold metallo-hydrolase [Planctomycetota bacterium]